MADTDQSTPSDEGTRAVLVGAQPTVTPVLRKRYAVIVGISQYQHPDLNLRYAHRDAEELYNLLRTPRGGGFPEENIVKLIDAEATTRNLTRALRSFLQQPGRDDIVLIYLACHGAPDPNRPKNVYLITHDTDPEDIPGTALPMEHIQDALEPRNLFAERVVLIADTCHSGAVGDNTGRRAIIDEDAAASRYLHALGQSKPGMAILTSAEASETSREDARWGGGHGVFTWHLLEGLRGKAENNRGEVTVGGLFNYVQKQVLAETGNQQHPVIGSTAFDREMPLAVTGDISTNEYFQLGSALLDVGWLLDDNERFASAERYLKEALRLAGELGQSLPEAQLLIGQARLAAGDAAGALTSLEQAAQELQGEAAAEAAFYRAMAYAQAGDKAKFSSAITDFQKPYAEDWRCSWLAGLAGLLTEESADAVGRALLIGIDEYANSQLSLRGPTNDIRLAQKMLVDYFNFDPTHIILLKNGQATRQGILDALAHLAAESDANDRVMVWYSGHAITQGTAAYLVCHDYDAGNSEGGVTPEELHAAMRAIPAQSTVAVLDTHGRDEFFALAAADRSYTLLIAEDGPTQTTQEQFIDGEYYGLFSYTLVQSIYRSPRATLHQIMQEVIETVRAKSNGRQTPRLVGDGGKALWDKVDWQQAAEVFAFSQRRSYAPYALADLEALEQTLVDDVHSAFPPFLHSLGRAYLEKEAFPQALKTLQIARQKAESVGYTDPTLLLSLALAQIRCYRYKDALETLHNYQKEFDEESGLEEVVATAEKLTVRRLYGLVVGVGSQQHPLLPPALGAANDAMFVSRLLIEKLGADKADVVMLLDKNATGANIRSEFRRLVEAAASEPAFFYFAGNGSLSGRGEPTLLPYDARTAPIPNDILLSELFDLAGLGQNNLVALIDAGWAAGDELPWGAPSRSRFVSLDVRPLPETRGIGTVVRQTLDKYRQRDWEADEPFHQRHRFVEQRLAEKGLAIGHTTLYPASLQTVIDREKLPQGIAVAEADFPPLFGEGPMLPQGALTHSFIQAVLQLLAVAEEEQELGRVADAAPTFARLLTAISTNLKWLQPFALGLRPAETLFSNVVQEEGVQSAIRRQVFERPLHQVAELSSRLLDRRDGEEMEAWLNLGIVQAAQGEYSQSIRSLQEVIKREGTGLPEFCHQAHYHLGRVMTITASAPSPAAFAVGYGEERPGDLDTAISELRDAIRGNPDNAMAYYYLGQAIFTRVQQEQLVEAQEAWEKYLALGAPAGRRAEVRQQLATLQSTRTGTGSGWDNSPFLGSGTGSG